MARVKAVKVDGEDVVIEVGETGVFWADVDGDRLEGKTLEALEVKLRDRVRSNREAVPVTQIISESSYYDDEEGKSPTFADVLLVGQNSRTNAALLRTEDGKAVKDSYNSSLRVRLSAERKAEYLQLWRAARDAKKALRAWDKKHELHVSTALRAASKKG